MNDLYSFRTKQIVKEVTSESSSQFNVNDLITSPLEHELLSISSLTYFISTTEQNSTYDKYNFNKENHELKILPSYNDWVTFNFFFDGETMETTGIKTGFYLNNTIQIKTCLFKCGKCYTPNECFNSNCKKNFAKYINSTDTECYPIEQNFPNYIYNQTSDFFEECYSTCKFCSLIGELCSHSSQNCKVCQDGYLRSYRFLGNCYKISYPYNTSNYFKLVNDINDEDFTIVNSCYDINKIPINKTGECVDSCPTSTTFYNYYYNESLDLSQQQETSIGYLYTLNEEDVPKYLFNKVCYSKCPHLTYKDSDNNVCKCNYGWFYNSTIDKTICYENDSCLSLDYYFHTDNKECILNGCKEGYYQFNYECYKDSCPLNTIQKDPNIKKCTSNLNYCIINENHKTRCSNIPYEGYNLKYSDTNIYFKSCNQSLEYFNTKTYLYKNICYVDCPEDTTKNEDNDRCSCNNFIHYVNEEKTDYECFQTGDKCASKGLYFDTEYKECYELQEKCIAKDKKIVGNECIDNCPVNSKKNNITKICECLYYYYYNIHSNNLECFDKGVTCEDKNYLYKSNSSKECFTSINDCLNKNYSYYFDNICYKNNCPDDKVPLNITVEDIKTKIINDLHLDKFKGERLCFCNTSRYEGWSIQNENSSVPYCLESCPPTYTKDPETNKCYYDCNPSVDFVFNNKCYKNSCPEGTSLKNETSRECSCEEFEEKDPETGLITCYEAYPELFYKDRKSCPYIYERNCISQCPENTCLSTNTKELIKCIDYNSQTMIKINSVCIEGIEEYAQTLNNIQNDEEFMPIVTASGVVLNAFSADTPLDQLINKYPNLTFVDLGECKEKLKNAYNLPQNAKLYIIGIDIPNLYGNSSVNIFDYEVYLRNGTQLDDFSACNGLRILISSNINDLERVNYYKAVDFYEEGGYDIYNLADLFYLDYCAPAHDEENDITLEDRAKYYYPNISICNEGCLYKQIDYDKQRFICHCNANLSDIENVNIEKLVIENDEEQTYLEYFLSLINYRIIICYNLFFEFKSFYSNAGFYISITISLFCLILFIVFWTKGMQNVKLIMYNNVPTLEKLKELLRKQRRKNKFNSNNNSFEDFDVNNNDENRSGNNVTSDFKIENKTSKQVIATRENSPQNSNNNTYHFVPRVNDTNYKSLFLQDFDSGKSGEKEMKVFDVYHRYVKGKTRRNKYRSENKEKGIKNEMPCSSKDNLIKMYNRYMTEKKNLFKMKSVIKAGKSSNNLNIYNINLNDNINNQNMQNLRKQLKTPEGNDSKELMNSSLINKVNPRKFSNNSSKNEILNIQSNEIGLKKMSGKKIIRAYRKSIVENIELKIDFNFERLIDRTDDEVEKREFNNMPFRQALRIDKRSFLEIFLSVLINKIELLTLFFFRNPYSSLSLSISIYLFELLLDLTMNCILYTDEVVSEKYHNNGELTMFTSLSLSLMSNIISSIIVYIMTKLTNYCEIIESIIKNVKIRKYYFENIIRLIKYMKLRLGIFYFLQLNFLLLMIYYLFIFCAIYHKSQGSIMINYMIGASTSLVISIGLTIIITSFRALSIKYHLIFLFNISKFLYDHF
jgi:hypothetical protein